MDGGLERLVRLLRDFAAAPPPPDSPILFYGLTPPGSSLTKILAKQSPGHFDHHAAYRFSLAFQSVVNIGVRGSEAIRSRVVQAGTLDVVGCILETWLKSKGFVTYPAASASGLSRERETREQKAARRMLQQQQQQEALAHYHGGMNSLARYNDVSDSEMNEAEPDFDPETADLNRAPPHLSPVVHAVTRPTPTRTRVDRSATVTARHAPSPLNLARATDRTDRAERRSANRTSPSARGTPRVGTPDTGNSQPTSASASDASPSRSPSPAPNATQRAQHHHHHHALNQPAVGIVDADPTSPIALPIQMNMNMTLDMNMMDPTLLGPGGFDGIQMGVGTNLDINDDLAMGAPPGAPGATIDIATPIPLMETSEGEGDGEIEDGDGEDSEDQPSAPGPSNGSGRQQRMGDGGATPRTSIGEATPRPTINPLPGATVTSTTLPAGTAFFNYDPIQRPAEPVPTARTTTFTVTVPPGVANASGRPMHTSNHHHHHHHHSNPRQPEVPYREEDVLLSLQLLAYLSKYPHVRQAFYMPRTILGEGEKKRTVGTIPGRGEGKDKEREREGGGSSSMNPLLKALGVGKSREKEKEKESIPPQMDGIPISEVHAPNVFALVERFTFRPHPSEMHLPNPPPVLPRDITHWAGVIMRNACRKDDLRGGIRQCASMVCGKWEKFPREFAKCRRCRKARYCGKECQSRAWAEGHRFWCSARENAGAAVTAHPVLIGEIGSDWGPIAALPRRIPPNVQAATAAPGTITRGAALHAPHLHHAQAHHHPHGVLPPGQTILRVGAAAAWDRLPTNAPPPPHGTAPQLPDRIVVGDRSTYESDEEIPLVGSPTGRHFPDIFSRAVARDAAPVPGRSAGAGVGATGGSNASASTTTMTTGGRRRNTAGSPSQLQQQPAHAYAANRHQGATTDEDVDMLSD